MARLLSSLIDLIFLIGVLWTLMQTLRRLFGTSNRGSRTGRNSGPGRKPASAGGKTVRDPVCGMFVSTEVSHRLVRGKETLHFCSQECLERYEKKAANA